MTRENVPMIKLILAAIVFFFSFGCAFAFEYDFSDDGEWGDEMEQAGAFDIDNENEFEFPNDQGMPEDPFTPNPNIGTDAPGAFVDQFGMVRPDITQEAFNEDSPLEGVAKPLDLPLYNRSSTTESRAVVGLEADNKLMGTPLSGNELVSFAESGYRGEEPNLERRSIVEKLNSLGPEERTRFGGLVVEQELGLMPEQYTRTNFIMPNNDRTINVFFASSYRDQEQPDTGSGVTFNSSNTEVIDTKKAFKGVEVIRGEVSQFKEIFAEAGQPFNGFDIGQMTDQQLYVSNLKTTDMHEKGHLFTNNFMEKWGSGDVSEDTDIKIGAYYDSNYIPTVTAMFDSTAEIAGYLAQFQGTDIPQFTLSQINVSAQSDVNDIARSGTPKSPQHFYAKKAVATNILDDAGFHDYIEQKALERLNIAHDWMPPQEEIDKKKAEIKEKYLDGFFFQPRFIAEQTDFIQQIPGQRIKEIARQHFKDLFGVENLPSTDLIKIPDEVLNRKLKQ